MNKSSFLGLNNFTLKYDGMHRPILDNINVIFNENESVAIVGPSGAGKSSLLNELYKRFPEHSYIAQNFMLVPQLSLFHNIFMGRLDFNSSIYNLINLVFPLKKEVSRIRKVASLLDIDNHLKKKCLSLSGGEQQRAAVIRAYYRNSDICFADEPTSAMDPLNAEKTLTLLTKNRVTIASMHNTDLAQKFFKRIIGLKEGKIFFDLQSDKVTKHLLEELYRD